MKRIFNTTGTCIPTRHFVADVSAKVDQVMAMAARGDYFTINRPRQYGKTTLMYHLFQALQEKKDYLPLDISFEGIGTSTYSAAQRFIPAVLDLLSMRLEFMEEKEAASLLEKNCNIHDFGKLSRFFTEFVRKTDRKVVLMIDEVDKSSNNQLFPDFLGMLRTKYLGRNAGKDYSFHSVILAGVYDVKTLKTKIRPDAEQKYNSPWNIAVDFEVDLALFPNEIAPMLEQYAGERQAVVPGVYQTHHQRGGFDFKEVEVSEEKRLDIVITFGNQKYIVELKIWRGEVYHREGIDRLCDYLDRQNQTRGYLLVYDLRKETGKQGEWEKIEQQGKEIYAAWI